MDATMYELRKLYEMLGTVLSAQYAEQIQTVCVAFFESGNKHPLEVPDFKTEKEYEDYLNLVWSKYKKKLYLDGFRGGAETQQNAIEAAFSDRAHMTGYGHLNRFDIHAVLDWLRAKVPHEP